jgi:hypothetical protein
MLRRCHEKKLVAWARWQCGVGPGWNEEKLWSIDTPHEVTVDYCRACRKDGGCAKAGTVCPEPQLLREAWPGVCAFLLVHTQWIVGGMGQRTGLNYASVLPLLERRLPQWQASDPETWGALTVDDLLDDVQVIESAMLSADAERREAERTKSSAGSP